jgi:hypothetical protein
VQQINQIRVCSSVSGAWREQRQLHCNGLHAARWKAAELTAASAYKADW